MSRQIDLTQSLTDEDRQYLVDRCRWEDLRLADEEHPVPEDRHPNTTPTAVDTPTALNPADVGTQNAELPAKPLPDDSVDAVAEWDDNYDDAGAWSYSDLQGEAKSRNVSAAGPREDVVARLREDDESGT